MSSLSEWIVADSLKFFKGDVVPWFLREDDSLLFCLASTDSLDESCSQAALSANNSVFLMIAVELIKGGCLFCFYSLLCTVCRR